jgi:hypothetical protein
MNFLKKHANNTKQGREEENKPEVIAEQKNLLKIT